MQAAILTAGEGAHFYPLTVTRPKGMSIVAGKPILQHTVEALRTSGIQDIRFVVGYKPERLRTFFGSGDNFGIRAQYVTQERPEGTGTAVQLAADASPKDEELVVLFGDNHYRPDLLLQLLSVKGDVLTASLTATPGRHDIIVAKNGLLLDYQEPAGREHALVNTGLMKFTPAFFEFLRKLPAHEKSHLPRAIRAYAKAGHRVNVLTVQEGWDEAESVWDLLRLNERMLAEMQPVPAPDLPNVTTEGHVVIGPNTIVRPGVRLIGPVYIGGDCEIRENSVVGPNVSIRNNVHIGSHSEVRNAIINNNVFIDSQCVIRFSILDDGVRTGPFTVLSEGEVIGALEIPSRVGAVLGPDTRLGTRVTVRPGTILGARSQVADGRIVEPSAQEAD